jgi:hypothetical protein
MKLRLLVLYVLISMSIAEYVGMAQTAGARGQQNRPAAAAPNRPAVAAPLPRARDGKPDLSGFWQAMNTANFDIQDHSARDGVPAGQGVVEGNELPYLPAALAQKQANYNARATADPETKCLAPGVPRLMYMPYPFQIVQDSRKVFMLFEYASHNRTIHTGRNHASERRPRAVVRATRAVTGREIRSSRTSPISTIRRGLIAQVISTATRCTWSNAIRSRTATT